MDVEHFLKKFPKLAFLFFGIKCNECNMMMNIYNDGKYECPKCHRKVKGNLWKRG